MLGTRTGHRVLTRSAHQPLLFPCPVALRRPCVAANAKRRELPRDYSFVELYSVVVEKLQERNCLLVQDTWQLIECIKTPEHANRCLGIIQSFLQLQEAKLAGTLDDPLMPMGAQQPPPTPAAAAASSDLSNFMSDWHLRKRFIARIAEIAVLELRQPQIVYAIVANWNRLKLSTYFGKDLIKQLGKYDNVPLEVLTQVASMVRQQRGPMDKGTRGAIMALLEVMQDRGATEQTVAGVKQMLAAQVPPAGPGPQPTPPAAAAAAPKRPAPAMQTMQA